MIRTRKLVVSAVTAVLVMGIAGVARARGGDEDALKAPPPAIERAINRVYPALIQIHVLTLEHEGGRERKFQASGSGAIISTDGYAVTNHHVAGKASAIKVILSSKEEIEATLVGTDALADIAVLKLDLKSRRPGMPPLPVAKWGRSADLKVGDPVLAMGCPLALSHSVTKGIVANIDMMIPKMYEAAGGFELDGEDVGSLVKWIGHDATIQPGNSGGPLVNLAGEIVGVNEISFGLAGAIPSDLVQDVVSALIREGTVRRSWLGFEVQPLVGAAADGALVSWVADGSPAAKAGVTAGDVLERIGDAAVVARFAEQLPAVNQLLYGLPIGRPVRLALRRAGAPVAVTITPEERGPARSARTEIRTWGMTAASLSAIEARELGRPSREGARVINLRPGGPASEAKPPLQDGDVIVEIDGQAIRSVADLESRTAAALAGGTTAELLVAFERGLERRLTVIQAGEPRQDSGGLEAAKAWVPVAVQTLTPPLAERLQLAGRTGVRVTRVLDERAGLKVGDVILAIDGEPVRATSPGDEEVFAAAIRRYRIGAGVALTIVRDGREMPLPITLAASPKPPREMARYADRDFEFVARDLTENDRDGRKVPPGTRGVFIESVSRGGWADLAQLNAGDIVLAVDGAPVTSVAELEIAMQAIAPRRPAFVILHVRRGVRTRFIELQPAWK